MFYAEKDSRIRYIRQKENIGVEKNFQFVLDQAEGDLFMWAADDDWWAPQHIRLLTDEHMNNQDLALSISAWDNLGPESIKFGKSPKANKFGTSKKKNFECYLMLHPMFTTPACFIYGIFKTDLVRLAFKNNSIDTFCGQDITVVLKTMCLGGISYIPTVTWKKSYDIFLPIPGERPLFFFQVLAKKYFRFIKSIYYGIFSFPSRFFSKLNCPNTEDIPIDNTTMEVSFLRLQFKHNIMRFEYVNELIRIYWNNCKYLKTLNFLVLIRDVIL